MNVWAPFRFAPCAKASTASWSTLRNASRDPAFLMVVPRQENATDSAARASNTDGVVKSVSTWTSSGSWTGSARRPTEMTLSK
jgi:hypothetical protein